MTQLTDESMAELQHDLQLTTHLWTHFRAVIRELVETEEEFGKDLQAVVERYIKTIDTDKKIPRIVRDSKDMIFMNFQQIADFHNT